MVIKSCGLIGFIKIAAHFTLVTQNQNSQLVLSQWGNGQMLLSIFCCCVPMYNSLFRSPSSSPSTAARRTITTTGSGTGSGGGLFKPGSGSGSSRHGNTGTGTRTGTGYTRSGSTATDTALSTLRSGTDTEKECKHGDGHGTIHIETGGPMAGQPYYERKFSIATKPSSCGACGRRLKSSSSHASTVVEHTFTVDGMQGMRPAAGNHEQDKIIQVDPYLEINEPLGIDGMDIGNAVGPEKELPPLPLRRAGGEGQEWEWIDLSPEKHLERDVKETFASRPVDTHASRGGFEERDGGSGYIREQKPPNLPIVDLMADGFSNLKEWTPHGASGPRRDAGDWV